MGIHGDDAQSYKTSANYKVIVMQWNSVLSEQQSFLSRFLLSMFAYNRIVPDAPDGHIVLDQLNDILYGTLDSRSYGPMQTGDNNGLARDLCHEYIKDAMQDRETRRYAKKWVVRPFKLLAAAPKPPGEE